MGDLIPDHKMLELREAFYQVAPDTRLRLSAEALSGTWDALAWFKQLLCDETRPFEWFGL